MPFTKEKPPTIMAEGKIHHFFNISKNRLLQPIPIGYNGKAVFLPL
jgi:hypothetical protein